MRKIISVVLSFGLLFQQSGMLYAAGEINLANYLSQAKSAIIQPDQFRPAQLRYISYNIKSNDFKLLLDKGDVFNQKTEKPKNEKTLEFLNSPNSSTPKLNPATQELFNYFLIGLSLPNDTFWVNLRPDAPENIIDPLLEKTDIGKIFLEADLQLKKDTASLTSPQNPEGKSYWDKLYKKAGELFGTENITIPTITRPWIVPNEVIVRETEDSAYIYKATLKVMLEADYLIGRGGSRTAPTPDQYAFSDPRLKELNEYSSQIIRETIIPKLTKEINSSKRYAQLRQVYYSLVLARWFKQKYSSLGSIGASANSYLGLIDSGNLANLASPEPCDKQAYFQAYQKSFKDGEYNLKETVATPFGQSIRSYISGGLGMGFPYKTVNSPVAGLKVISSSVTDILTEQPSVTTASPLTEAKKMALNILKASDKYMQKVRTGYGSNKFKIYFNELKNKKQEEVLGYIMEIKNELSALRPTIQQKKEGYLKEASKLTGERSKKIAKLLGSAESIELDERMSYLRSSLQDEIDGAKWRAEYYDHYEKELKVVIEKLEGLLNEKSDTLEKHAGSSLTDAEARYILLRDTRNIENIIYFSTLQYTDKKALSNYLSNPVQPDIMSAVYKADNIRLSNKNIEWLSDINVEDSFEADILLSKRDVIVELGADFYSAIPEISEMSKRIPSLLDHKDIGDFLCEVIKTLNKINKDNSLKAPKGSSVDDYDGKLKELRIRMYRKELARIIYSGVVRFPAQTFQAVENTLINNFVSQAVVDIKNAVKDAVAENIKSSREINIALQPDLLFARLSDMEKKLSDPSGAADSPLTIKQFKDKASKILRDLGNNFLEESIRIEYISGRKNLIKYAKQIIPKIELKIKRANRDEEGSRASANMYNAQAKQEVNRELRNLRQGIGYSTDFASVNALEEQARQASAQAKQYANTGSNLESAKKSLSNLIKELSSSSPTNIETASLGIPGSDLKNGLGGIDLTDRMLKIKLERVGSFASSALTLPEINNVEALDLDKEFEQIQVMVSSSIRPSDTRILEFAAACYYRGEFDQRLAQVSSCIKSAHLADEISGRDSSEVLRLATMLPDALYGG